MRSALQPLVVVGLSAVTAVNGLAIADKLDAASIPTGAVFVCAVGSGKDRTIATIELEEKVAALCRRHTDGSVPKCAQRVPQERGPRIRPRWQRDNPSRRNRIRQESDARARWAVIPPSM